ncbi:MAG: DUF1819 family protein [Rhodothermaceae bacterium]|nr:DUF1819 family protein [Rhodothermaceae bacterium]
MEITNDPIHDTSEKDQIPGEQVSGKPVNSVLKQAAKYRSTITSASLMVPESRTIARLLLKDGGSDWRNHIVVNNVLQIRSSRAALSIAQVLRARLRLMGPELLDMVISGTRDTATHACFAAAIKHSALLGDYLDLVLREKYRLFVPKLRPGDWSRYIDDCRARDPEMAVWAESTVLRLRWVVHDMLAEMGYIDSTRSLRLHSVRVVPDVLRYLENEQEHYVLKCITVCP